MDATRTRRTRDCARQRWYAAWRCQRFARHLGFTSLAVILPGDVPQRDYASSHDLMAFSLDGEEICPWELSFCSD
jgi:hypothetical protein